MESYTSRGGLKRLLKDFKKDDIAKLYIAELNKNCQLNSTLINESSIKEPTSVDQEKSNDEIPATANNSEHIILQASLTQEPCHKSMISDNNNNDKSSLDTFIEEHNNKNNADDVSVTSNVVNCPKANNEKKHDVQKDEISARTDVTDVITNMCERIYKLEKKCASNDQYSRRNNIEITGIPDSVPNNLLEGKVLEILSYLNINLKYWDIEACHRLNNNPNSKSPARVIVRFVNRKNTLAALSRKKSLRNISLKSDGQNKFNNKIYINENLCQSYREIYDFAYKLLKQNVINHLWSYKGIVHLRINADDNNNNKDAISFTHIDDIKEFFM